MNRAALLITVAIIAIVIGGFYTYQKLFVKKDVSPWQLVPHDAIAVFEKNRCNACASELAKSSVGLLAKNVIAFSHPVDSLQQKLLSLAETSTSLLISAHATKKDDIDFIFYSNDVKAIQNIQNSFRRLKYSVVKRSFSGVEINEIKIAGQKFSFAEFDHLWVGTYTPFLVEDVIRTWNAGTDQSSSSFKRFNFASNADDAGNFYINLRQLNSLLSLFTSDEVLTFPLGVATSLDAKREENSIVLNGFSFDSAAERSTNLLGIFRHQSPTSLGLKNFVSNRSLAVTAYGISNGKQFGSDLIVYMKDNGKRISDTVERIESKAKVDFQQLYESIRDEVIVNHFDAGRARPTTKVLLVETTDANIWLSALNKVSATFSDDTVFREHYSSFEIRQVPIRDFVGKLLYPIVTGFGESYYTAMGNTVLIGSDLETLKDFIDDVNDDDTWGKSVAQNRFLESTLLESNLSLYFNPSRSLKFLLNRLHPRWQDFVRQNQSLVQSIQMSAVQFSHLNQNYYTNLIFTYRDFNPNASASKATGDKILVNFEKKLTNLYAVRSHVNRSNEILVQDSSLELSLVSSDGKIMWNLLMPGRIISDVVQIDFFNNGKLQYFFATDHALHVVDRLGNYVQGFPLQTPGVDIRFVSVVDYDNSKKYRFLITDVKGRLWMYDKEGQNLDGWNPKDTGAPLAFAARHYRLKGKDYVVATRADGKVLIMTRRGETMKNSPVDLAALPVGDFAVESGSSVDNTYFVFVVRDGFKIKVSLDGKVQAREPLLKTSIRSTFGLVNEKALKSYFIVQQDNKQLTVADDEGKKLFETSAATPTSTDIKYYVFASGDAFVIVTDKAQNLSFIYDSKGNLLTATPIESSQVEVRPVDSDRFMVFFIHDRQLTVQPL